MKIYLKKQITVLWDQLFVTASSQSVPQVCSAYQSASSQVVDQALPSDWSPEIYFIHYFSKD